MSIEDTKRKRAAAQHLADEAGGAPTKQRQRPIVGTFAQVSLLPREMLQADHRRAVRRRLVAGVVLTAVVVAAGIAGSAALAVGATASLAVQNAQAAQLTQQLTKYQAVQQLQGKLALGKAAVRVGSSTAVDWDTEIDRIKSKIPAGYKITAISTDAASPVTDYAQGGTPLDAPRAATVTITAKTSSLSQLPTWISAVTALPEVADASPSVNTADSSKYTVVLTTHLTTKAYMTPLTTGAGQ
ncbi:hypothetical protein [Amnibacterium sp.]|uniref:hypothetical protein n=1 Tax=Amnibacterium sp. TaxID=1872496 RepID=UPI00261F697A|nr:hypothetical protein [Amnibacterium sp.]MCU1474305.1 hypothetical protein [Amnibacterium sp.]